MREGAFQSLRALRLETVTQSHGNFREIQRGGPPEKFSSRGNAIRGDRGLLPLQAASDIHLPCLRGVFFGISGRITGEIISLEALRGSRMAPPPPRMMECSRRLESPFIG